MSTENRRQFGVTLSKLLKTNGLSVPEFSKKIDEPERTVRLWEKGANIPRAHKLKKIADFFNVSPEIFSFEPPESDARIIPAPSFRKLPVVSWTTAGLAKDYQDLATQIDEMVDSTTRDPNAFAVEVVGDSMENLVLGGDRIVLEPNREATNGDMAYVRFTDEAGGGGTLKWFYRTGPRAENVKLVAENEAHQPREEEVSGKMILFAYPVINIVRRVQKRRLMK